jgi:hypothetical protein
MEICIKRNNWKETQKVSGYNSLSAESSTSFEMEKMKTIVR